MGDLQERDVFVVFTDICGYTHFVSTKGTAAGMELRRKHDDTAKPVVSQFDGVYVKSTGDGMIAYFQKAEQAVKAAVKVQEKFSAYNGACPPDGQIHVRIGIQYGTAIAADGDIVGQAVNFAARLVAVCQPDQILLGKEVYRKLKRTKSVNLKRVGATALHGIPQPEDVYEVGWQYDILEEKKKGRFLLPLPARSGLWKYRFVAIGAALAVLAALGVARWLRQPNPVRSAASVDAPHRAEAGSPALQFYALALQSLKKGDDEEALEELNQAIDADHTLYDAYFDAAYICLQNYQYAKGLDYLAKLRHAAKMLDPATKLRVEALGLEFDGEQDGALRKYDALVDLRPEDAAAQYYLGDLALEMGRQDKARAALARCIALKPENPFCQFDWMELLVRSNDFYGAIRYSGEMKSKNLSYPWFDEPVGYAFMGTGDLAAAQRCFQTLKDVSQRLHGRYHFRAAEDGLADLALYQGRLSDAAENLNRSAQTTNSPGERSHYLLEAAWNWALVGNKAEASSAAQRAARESSDALTQVEAARVLAMVGSADAAHTLLYALAAAGKAEVQVGPDTQNFIDGALALAQHNPEKAIDDFRSSFDFKHDVETTYMLGQAYLAAGLYDNAAAAFLKVVSAKGSVLSDSTPAIWVLAQYHLGRCYDLQGDADHAMKYYAQFLDLWKDADHDLPPLADARKATAKLQHTSDLTPPAAPPQKTP